MYFRFSPRKLYVHTVHCHSISKVSGRNTEKCRSLTCVSFGFFEGTKQNFPFSGTKHLPIRDIRAASRCAVDVPSLRVRYGFSIGVHVIVLVGTWTVPMREAEQRNNPTIQTVRGFPGFGLRTIKTVDSKPMMCLRTTMCLNRPNTSENDRAILDNATKVPR